MRGRYTSWLAVSLAAVMFLAGCELFKGGPLLGGAATQPEGTWKIRPVRMRVFPSTRFVTDNSQALLEARIEFFDEAGDSTKAVGTVRLELLAQSRTSEAGVGEQLYGWEIPVITLADNKRFYDPITRAYLFRLKMDDLSRVGQPVVLRCVFTPVEGERIQTQTTLNP